MLLAPEGARAIVDALRDIEGVQLTSWQRTDDVAATLDDAQIAALRDAVALMPGNEDTVCSLAEVLVKAGKSEEALSFLARLPETDRVRRIAASARLAMNPVDNLDEELNSLLPRVKTDETARQEFLDILETMGPSDPRTAKYRRLLSSHLY